MSQENGVTRRGLFMKLGILFNGYMMYKLGWLNWARLFIWLAIGLVVYFSYGRKNSRVQAALADADTRRVPGR